MRIGLMHGDDGSRTIEQQIQQLIGEENDGFDCAWFGQIFGGDAMTIIALAGQRTSRMEFGTAVVPTYPRHPFAMAQQAMTVQAATGGRFTLGIGPSHQMVIENMWGMSYDKPAKHVREYLKVLLPLVREGKVAYKGNLFSTGANISVREMKPLPVIISALAPVMLKLAGSLADGTTTWMTGPRTIETHIVPSISAAAKEAGRPAPRVVVGLPICVTDDVAAAKEMAAKAFVIYGTLPNYRRMLDKEGAAGPADVAIVGNESQVELQLRDLASAGSTDFNAAIFPSGPDAAGSMSRTHALLKSLIGQGLRQGDLMTTAIVSATLIDGTGRDPVPNATVLIDGERITAAGAGVETPRDAEIIDAVGRTVMPGMIDCHVHLYGRVAALQERMLTPPSLQLFYGARNALRTLDAGFTSVRDASGSPVGFKMAIERGLIPGPRMKISVVALSQTGGHGDSTMPSGVRTGGPVGGGKGPEFPENVVDGPHEARRAVRQILRAGADFIKLMSTGGVMSPSDEPRHTQFTPEEIAVMVYEARAAGKTCMAHAQGTQGIKNAVLAGVESIEHGIWLDDEVMAEMKHRRTFLVPTLVAPMWVLRHAERTPGSILPQSIRKTKEVIDDHKSSFRAAVESGVRIAMGTDSGVGHHGSNAEELQQMVEGGMTPMQAIVATTKTASECIHLHDDVGTLEPGKLADLLVVDGDPLADITVLQGRARLSLIMQGGRTHKNELETRAAVGA